MNKGLSYASTDQKLFKEIILHLDLKGAPPTFEFLIKYIIFLGKNYEGFITGLIFEFEDTFPYEGDLI
jgi:hypothetical protein